MRFDNRTKYDTKFLYQVADYVYDQIAEAYGPLPDWARLRVRVTYPTTVRTQWGHHGVTNWGDGAFNVEVPEPTALDDFVLAKLMGDPVDQTQATTLFAHALAEGLIRCYTREERRRAAERRGLKPKVWDGFYGEFTANDIKLPKTLDPNLNVRVKRKNKPSRRS